MNQETQEDTTKEQAGKEGHQMMHVSFSQGGELPDNRAYLDGCSTVTAFKYKKFLENLRQVKGGIKINCNAGAVTTDIKGDFGGLSVWYLPDGIANIFSMHELEKLYRITYNSWEGFYVEHTPRGEVHFHKDEQGLPYIDLAKSRHEAARMLMQLAEMTVSGDDKTAQVGSSFMQTVRGNYEGYTKREVVRAKEARQGQALLGNPSEKDYQGMVSSNMKKNCPISTSDVSNARAIFGPDLASVRGKTVRRTPAPVMADYVSVPRSLVETNRIITLAADVFFVNGTPFLTTVARHMKFVTAEHVPVRTATNLSKHITQVLEVYKRAGFVVRTILMDGEFEKIRPLLPNLECNTTAAKEHVSKAERTIRTTKERTRGLLATLSFSNMPRRMMIEFVYFIVLWLNAFPIKSGISSTFSPRELLVRWRLDYKKHCQVLPGTYCEVHDEPVPTNTMTPRTHECIALDPTGNLQGSVKFYCLTTGRVLKRRSFTPMPMPDRIIRRVNTLGELEGQGHTFRFLNQHKEPYEWTDSVPEDDPEFQGLLENEDEAPYPDISAELPGVALAIEEHDFTPVTDEPEDDFHDLAGAALHNAGIDADQRIHAALNANNEHRAPAIIEANEDEIVSEVTFDTLSLQDAGLSIADALGANLGDQNNDTIVPTIIADDTDAHNPQSRYPTRARRSVIGNQPYDALPHAWLSSNWVRREPTGMFSKQSSSFGCPRKKKCLQQLRQVLRQQSMRPYIVTTRQ